MLFKLRVRDEGGHFRVTVFSGKAPDQMFANCGDLMFRHDETFVEDFIKPLNPVSVEADCDFPEEDYPADLL